MTGRWGRLTEFEKIQKAVSSFGLPYTQEVYKGTEKRWFTYNYVNERGMLYSDDEPGTVGAVVQVHLFLPINENFISLKNGIRKNLFEEGFTFPKVTILTEDEKKLHHIIFECEIEEE